MDMDENRLQVVVLSNRLRGRTKMLCQRVDKVSAGGKIGVSWMTGALVVGVAVRWRCCSRYAGS